MILEQLPIWHSQYPSGQCTSAAVECCGLKGGRGGRGTNKGCRCAAMESKNAKVSLEIAKLRHPVACREQSCRPWTRCASPLPRLHCAPTLQALPPCITGHLFCPLLRGWQPTQEPAVVVHGKSAKSQKPNESAEQIGKIQQISRKNQRSRPNLAADLGGGGGLHSLGLLQRTN